MAKSKGKAKVARDTSFEDGVEELEQIIERIESGEIGLEESLTHYERGMALIQHCKTVLADCEQRVEDLTKELQAADTQQDAAAAGDAADSQDADAGADEDVPI
jgi:exodeoxyribonuclease VII small subunit